MLRNKKGFTLIELIIVVVIIGILAVVAMPKYFANIEKARRAEALSTMGAIRDAMIAYSSANNGVYPATTANPIVVTLEGDDVLSLSIPTSSSFNYSFTNAAATAEVKAAKKPLITGWNYTMVVATGFVTTS